MSRKGEKKKQSEAKAVINKKEQQQTLQVQLQQQYAQAQAMLMLTQLNSAYFKMHLTLTKNLTRVENKYYSVKLGAFLTLSNYKNHVYETQVKLSHNYGQQTPSSHSILSENNIMSEGTTLQKLKSKSFIIINETITEAKSKVFIKSRTILRRMMKLLANKRESIICSSFYQLIKNSNENSTIKILSDKSSKIQTIDSQKSKIFKRSLENRPSRKSFSLQKSIKESKNKYYVPIKYQIQNKMSTPPILSSQTSGIQQQKTDQGCMTDFAKFLQKTPDPLLIDRRNLLSANRQRKILKSTSTKKINASALVYGKEQKIRQLQYLQRKYKKLIAQFNWFSERFLKVIEEETI